MSVKVRASEVVGFLLSPRILSTMWLVSPAFMRLVSYMASSHERVAAAPRSLDNP
jgi:hypothetical protein